jgi:phosphofructokinase-like protein
MASSRIKCIGILTAGGDCPGLNAVIRAVVKTASWQGIDVVGVRDGFLGLIQNSMDLLDPEDVDHILTQGGTILGSSNKDNPFHFLQKDANGREKYVDRSADVIANIKRLGIQALVVLGGDGSMTLAQGFSKKGVKIIGVPKTIDNDLVGTDQTFGYDTAVSVATEAIDRLQSVAASHHRVMVVEVMGRYAGWLALKSGIAGGADIILIPEIPYHEKKIGETILQRQKEGKKSSIIVVAEGAFPKGGSMVFEHINDHQRARLGGICRRLARHLEVRHGVETRSVMLGHTVRGGTPTAFDRALATLFGVHAVELVREGRFGRMVTWKNGALSSVPLSVPGGKNRKVPLDHPMVQAAKNIGISFGV